MDWSCEDVLDFLRLYESEPIIWDPTHPDYKNRHKVYEAWRRLAEMMGPKFEVRELKAKKLSLMATYRKLATKVRSSQEEPYKPDWFAYEAMDRFLNGVYEPRTGGTKMIKQEFKLEHNSSAEDDDHITEDVAESEGSMDAGSSDRIPNLDTYLEVTVDEPMTRKRLHEPGTTATPSNQLDNGFRLLKNMFEKPEPDECSLFGEFLAKKLRALDQDTREVAMLEIHSTLFRVTRGQGSHGSKGEEIRRSSNGPVTYPSSSQE